MTAPKYFSFSDQQLRQLAEQVLDCARRKGATDCAMEVSEGSGLSVTVRKQAVETIEQNRDKSLAVTTYLGLRKGHASTADFSSSAIDDTVQAALDIARYTAEDTCAGLPDADQLEFAPKALGLFKAWDVDAAGAIALASRAEAAAFATDARIKNSEGASVSAQHSHFVAANTRGFVGGYAYSRHYISCAPIARDRRQMQRDDWYTSSRDPSRLASPEAVGRYAAERALARLGARRLSTRTCPVLFDAPLACGLLGSFVQAVSGGALYRRSSFLIDSLGTQVFPRHIDVLEDPHVRGAMGSAPFDEEGVRTRKRAVVRQGTVEGYFLSTYSARKLGMRSTGNAGGSHNLRLRSSQTRRDDDLEHMLRRMGTGLLITELMGQGVNYVSGDYSRGAAGFWVENGVIVFPVEEVTIAGNLRDMFRQIVAVGADTIVRGTKETGSILIEAMTVAGD